MNVVDVSIVIRTKNEAECIEETLTKVREQEFSGAYEIIIVDSGSTDSTLDIIRRYDVTLLEIPQREFTYGRALNVGAGNAKGEFVVNLSAHAFPRDKKWLTNLVGGFEDDNVAGVYGRQLSVGKLNPFEAFKNERFFGGEKIAFNKKNRKTLKRIHFSNGNCAIRKDVWHRFKFNEQVPWAEDILWQKEVLKAGFSVIYAPEAAVYHTHPVNICKAYKISRDCAVVLASMDRKKQSIWMITYDLAVFLSLVPSSILQNVSYTWRNRHLQYLGVAPIFVLSTLFGWLVGRIEYRVSK